MQGTVIYVGGFELPDKDAAAHRVISNAKILEKLNYKVVFIDVNRGNNKKKSKKLKPFQVKSVDFPETNKEWFKYLTNINLIKETVDEYPDTKVIICYNYPSLLLQKTIEFCKRKNIKLICDITEWYEDKRIIKRIDTTIRMRYLNKKVDGIICISSYLHNYYKESTNTIIIPPLVDLQEKKWRQLPESSLSNKIKFVYSGNPGKHKDKLNLIIEALSEITMNKNYEFQIIGITKEQHLGFYPYQNEILDKLKEKVKFMGRISHEKSMKFVKEANFQIFVRENKRVNNAGFPTKFVESMSCGTPVITTNTSDLSKYLTVNKNGYFVEHNNVNTLISLFNEIFLMDLTELKKKEKYCLEIKIFDYRCYSNQMNEFLERL